MMGLARGARPLPHRERHLGHFISIGGTRFATRIPTSYDDHRLSALGRFVLQLTAKFAKAHIRDLTRQLVIFKHPGHVQVFDGDHVEAPHEIGGQLMQGVRPDIRNPGMEPGDADLGFRHIPRLGNVHSFRNRFAGLEPGPDFRDLHLATELL